MVVGRLIATSVFALDAMWKAIWIIIWYCLFAPFFDHMRK